MKHRTLLAACCLMPLLCLLAACTTDSYEKGTGDYSLMQADLADLAVDDQKRVTAFTTDDGQLLRLRQLVGISWIAHADTTYRAIVYYNKVEETQADLLAVGSVPTLIPQSPEQLKDMADDPVGLESSWIGRTGRYLNMGLLIKTGRVDDEEGPHTIKLAEDSIVTHADQRRTAHYRLLHDQGDVPQYYTNRHYVSILLPQQDRPDSVTLTINTYDGIITRTFAL